MILSHDTLSRLHQLLIKYSAFTLAGTAMEGARLDVERWQEREEPAAESDPAAQP
ncbi:hypothetical protein [Pantoea sp. 1.19]|uniref:hypothetical protein n=1 Tax=Pantoea sp. 1.19 TaxID=1925589 RepID=UPI00147DE613|nr:hypothetical protein [Pantoea sp. 1.19]